MARTYLGYTYKEFWYEANPFELMEAWRAYAGLNGWLKDDEEEDGKDYYTIDDL